MRGAHFKRFVFQCPKCRGRDTVVERSRPLKGPKRLRLIRCKRPTCNHVWTKVTDGK